MRGDSGGYSQMSDKPAEPDANKFDAEKADWAEENLK